MFNLLDAHRRAGDDLPACDLYPEIVRALKWVHSQDPDEAVRLAWHALEEVAGYTETEGGPSREGRRPLPAFLPHPDHTPFGAWSEDDADRLVKAALIES
ncbi:hypothetical protein ACWEFL_35570 [Streptomyces sp. NPDC004838]